jgi:hypothetical protein
VFDQSHFYVWPSLLKSVGPVRPPHSPLILSTARVPECFRPSFSAEEHASGLISAVVGLQCDPVPVLAAGFLYKSSPIFMWILV